MWNYIIDKTVKTRKPHECALCGGDITIGGNAIARTGTDNGIYTFYMHIECKKYIHNWDGIDWESSDQ